MKILLISAVFPPRIIGGAELSAYNLGQWLASRGHSVGVLTVAEDASDELRGEMVDGLRLWRLRSPRDHTQHTHRQKSAASKLLWHLQDHLDPRNRLQLNGVIEEFKPDAVSVHVLQGIGHNALSALAPLDIPVLYFMHDLTLACIRQCMYRNDGNCEDQCTACARSSGQKYKALESIKNLQFISPSRSNLETIERFVDLSRFPRHVIPNLDLEEAVERQPGIPGSPPRFLYVGRVDRTKGVDFVLSALDAVAQQGHHFKMTVVGGGPQEDFLRAKYASRPWLEFAGKVAPTKVQDFLRHSDLLLLPSLWRENHPGIVRKALRAGIPAIVSDSGGSKEMLLDGESGIVLPAGDETAWTRKLTLLATNEKQLLALQAGARRAGQSYSVDALGETILALLEKRDAPATRGLDILRTKLEQPSTNALEQAVPKAWHGRETETPEFQEAEKEVPDVPNRQR